MSIMSRILIVDDEKDITNPLKIGFASHRVNRDAYSDPREALATYEAGKYGLIIIDIRMPGMNGFDLFREIKSRDGKAKVCFLTAFDMYAGEFKQRLPDREERRE